jgi:hypothetical protein
MNGDLTLLSSEFEDTFVSDYEIILRQPFRLFDLPSELWLKICEFNVVRNKPILLGRESHLYQSTAIVRQPAIAQTCRLLRREALSMFYSINDFGMLHSYGAPCPRQWTIAIGHANRMRMRHLEVRSNCLKDFWEGSFKRAGIDCELELLGPWLSPQLNTYQVTFK